MAESDLDAEEKKDMNYVLVEQHPECAVCLQPCLQPVKLPCSHVFCFLCLKGFAYRSKKCALCRDVIDLEYFDNPLVIKVREESVLQSEDGKRETYDWFYEGRNGWWQYDARASAALEEAFASETRTCELHVAGFFYVVDFENMVQYRKANAVRCRRIKRDRANVERKGVAGLKHQPVEETNCDDKDINAVTDGVKHLSAKD